MSLIFFVYICIMKRIQRILSVFLFATAIATGASGEKIVILHTNDTHSDIDSSKGGIGGILPRKAIVDSIRGAEKNVLLVDAGDMVQGTLYFNLYRGDVEYPLFNMMGYDVRILGNHEFDNGLEELARHWRGVKADALSANYDFSDTPVKGIFKPYTIKKIGGKKIGFVGININPARLISGQNYEGVKFADPIETANRVAAELKHKKGCDLVVAVTHIGYDAEGTNLPTDPDLARSSRDIDIIIGGHSHTFVDPAKPEKTPYLIPNAEGRDVLVVQTGKSGRNLGYIKIDTDKPGAAKYVYAPIPVTDRFEKYDSRMVEFLQLYKAKVDSINNRRIGYSSMAMDNMRRTGAYPNWAADFALWMGNHIVDSLRIEKPDFPEVEIGFMNVGGIRQPMSEGVITQGEMEATFPFSNDLEIIRIKGSEFIATMEKAAAKGGEGVSRDIRVITNPDGNVSVLYRNEPMDPEKEYTVCTISYLSQGNDGYEQMANHEKLWVDSDKVSKRILEYVEILDRNGLAVDADSRDRFIFRR